MCLGFTICFFLHIFAVIIENLTDMKITKFFMMLVAAAAMMFVACNKDDHKDKTPTEAAANTLVYNGKVYQMRSTYKYEQSGRVYIDAYAMDTLDNGLPIFKIISDNPGNGTYDLTNGGGVFFGLTSEVEYITGFHSSDTYSSGTVTIEKDENAFRMKMIGQVANGPAVSFHIYVPVSEWEQLEW